VCGRRREGSAYKSLRLSHKCGRGTAPMQLASTPIIERRGFLADESYALPINGDAHGSIGHLGFAFATELSVVSLDQGPLRCGLPLRCIASFADVTRMWEASDWYHLTLLSSDFEEVKSLRQQ
jgi:hypothetical protein